MDFLGQIYLLTLFRTNREWNKSTQTYMPFFYTIFWMSAPWNFNKSIIYSSDEHLTKLQSNNHHSSLGIHLYFSNNLQKYF